MPKRVVIGEAELWCGDCREIMPTIIYADAILTDPPYDERTHKRARSLKNGGSDIGIDFAHLSEFEHVAPMLELSAGWVICFCALEQLGGYQTAAGPERWMRAAVWDRPDGTPQISGDRPGQGAEGIAVMHSRKVRQRWNGGGERGLWRYPRNKEETGHSTAKPIALMQRLVTLFSDAGQVVLDPYMGSGTTGIACLQTGRRFIGIEREQKYFDIACERIDAAYRQGKLFDDHPDTKVDTPDIFDALEGDAA